MNNGPLQMIMQLMTSGQNPQAILQNLMNQNPNAQAILNQMNQSGMNPREFVQQYCRQNNIDLSQIQNLANSRGIKL